MRVVLALLALAGCAELGVVGDGTSISVGRPSRGYLLDGKRLPDTGEGYTTREQWRARGNRYGTDELLDLITAVGRRLSAHTKGPRLVVADLSSNGGGEARRWHRSHQSGRDVDLIYFMRDAQGKPMEADAMRVFDALGRARDGSGITVDVPRTWALVKELVTAPEATVQWVFMYEPIAAKVLDYARSAGEPEKVIARARLAMKQPGDSAPHNDHLHIRVYCSARDRAFGCVDFGPRELLAERERDQAIDGDYPTQVARLVADAATAGVTEGVVAEAPTQAPGGTAATSVATAMTAPRDLTSLGRLLRMPLRRWR